MPSKLDADPEPDAILSVADLTRRIKALLEGEVPACWVRGEISNLRKQSSGHVYFTLKDRDSQLPCVIFKGDAMRSTVELDDGQQVILFGSLSVYEPHGRYQFIGRHVLQDGAGRLQAEFERLKKKLAAEGLFDSERKKPLPKLPRTVGIVTSPTGAALKDFLSILQRREWKGRVILLPAKVQGQGAAEEIVTQIKNAEKLGEIDLLVVGRGGGSIEDLWCFNQEIVARAVAACPIPIISAVGHEIDFTLSDFAADKRAETPSAAAELISSAYLELLERLKSHAKELLEIPEWIFERRKNQLDRLAGSLRENSPQRRIEEFSLALDELQNRMQYAWRDRRQMATNQCMQVAQSLAEHSPRQRIKLARLQLGAATKRYDIQLAKGLQSYAERLKVIQERMESASIQRALARGFVVVRDESGKLVTRREAIKLGDALAIDFSDGEVHVRVDQVE